MTLKQIREIKKTADMERLDGNNMEYLKLMVEYHMEYAEYYNDRIGDISNNDDEYTRKWDYHNNQMGKYHSQLQKLKTEKLMNEYNCDCGQTPCQCDELNNENLRIQSIRNNAIKNGVDVENVAIDINPKMINVKIDCEIDYMGECKNEHCYCGENPSYTPMDNPDYECCDDCVYNVIDGMECLTQYGINYDDLSKMFTFSTNTNLKNILNIVNGAYEILESYGTYENMDNGDNQRNETYINDIISKWDTNEFRFPDESKNYYLEFMCDCGDDTVFDYHGTFVMDILEFLIKKTESPKNENKMINVKIDCDLKIDECMEKFCDDENGNYNCLHMSLGETHEPFSYFGIDIDLENNIISYPESLDLQKTFNTVTNALDIADHTGDELSLSSRATDCKCELFECTCDNSHLLKHYNSDVVNYFNEFFRNCDGGDDLDYHGSYVINVLEYLICKSCTHYIDPNYGGCDCHEFEHYTPKSHDDFQCDPNDRNVDWSEKCGKCNYNQNNECVRCSKCHGINECSCDEKCKLPHGNHDRFLNCDNDDCEYFMNGCYWGACIIDGQHETFVKCENQHCEHAINKTCDRHINYRKSIIDNDANCKTCYHKFTDGDSGCKYEKTCREYDKYVLWGVLMMLTIENVDWELFKRVIMLIDENGFDPHLVDCERFIDNINYGLMDGNKHVFAYKHNNGIVWNVDIDVLKLWRDMLNELANDAMMDGFNGNISRNDYNVIQLICDAIETYIVDDINTFHGSLSACVGKTIAKFEFIDHECEYDNDMGCECRDNMGKTKLTFTDGAECMLWFDTDDFDYVAEFKKLGVYKNGIK